MVGEVMGALAQSSCYCELSPFTFQNQGLYVSSRWSQELSIFSLGINLTCDLYKSGLLNVAYFQNNKPNQCN